jgi:hypothetical protein
LIINFSNFFNFILIVIAQATLTFCIKILSYNNKIPPPFLLYSFPFFIPLLLLFGLKLKIWPNFFTLALGKIGIVQKKWAE